MKKAGKIETCGIEDLLVISPKKHRDTFSARKDRGLYNILFSGSNPLNYSPAIGH